MAGMLGIASVYHRFSHSLNPATSSSLASAAFVSSLNPRLAGNIRGSRVLSFLWEIFCIAFHWIKRLVDSVRTQRPVPGHTVGVSLSPGIPEG
eukprot:2549431-Rhodomonas_salina.2